MRRDFVSYSITILDEPFEKKGVSWPQTAKVFLLDATGNSLGSELLGYALPELVHDCLLTKGSLCLDYCYVPNFSLQAFRKRQGEPERASVALVGFSAHNAFFDSDLPEGTDFSYAVFGDCDVNLDHTVFGKGDLSFYGARFGSGNVYFDYALFMGNVEMNRSVFGQGLVSFKSAIFRSGIKSFQYVNFGFGELSFINAEFGPGELRFGSSLFGGVKTTFKVARMLDCNVDFHKAVFKSGETNFVRTDFGTGSVSFSGSIFECTKSNFLSARFAGDSVNFEKVHFKKGEVLFGKASFGNCSVSFRDAVFSGKPVDFSRAEFGRGDISFENAVFGDGDTLFVDTNFGDGKLNFKAVVFGKGKVDFHFSTFGYGDVVFNKTVFGDGLIDFSKVHFNHGKVGFVRAEFGDGDVMFDGSELRNCSMNFKNTLFRSGTIGFSEVDFSTAQLVFDTTDFDRKTVSFRDSVFDKLVLHSCQLNNYFDLRVKKAGEIDLSDSIIRDIVDLTPHSYHVELAALKLIGVRLLGRVYIDWHANNVKHFVYDQETSYRQKSEQFRILKENYNSIGQYSDEDEAYVEFKRTEAKADLEESLHKSSPWKRFHYLSYWFRWLVFDKMGLYATDPVRVLLSMVVSYVLFSLLYLFMPMITDGDIISSLFDTQDPRYLPTVERAFYHSAITFLTIGYGDYYPQGIDRLLSSIEGFLGLFLMSYFTVAFVRKILR